MKRNIYLIAIFIGIIFFLPARSAIANITNPDFDDVDENGVIDGWIHNDLVSAWTTGSVQFAPDGERLVQDGFLSQVFTLDSGSTTLSFDVEISVIGGETGIFTAALLDMEPGNEGTPLFDLDDQGHFFSKSSLGITVGTNSLDVSGLMGPGGRDVKLVFNLNNDYDGDDPSDDSIATLSNLTIIPEPATMTLLGLGALGLLRRKR
jgi:hypothetical protein